MSDARALLRQQRAARRIDHPHAQYTAPGKLSCSICHEPIKSETLWENHTRTVTHRQKLLATTNKATATPKIAAAETSKPKSSTDSLSNAALLAQFTAGQKRKHAADDDDDDDENMEDAFASDDEAAHARAKRSRADIEGGSNGGRGGSPNRAALSALDAPAVNGSADSQSPTADTTPTNKGRERSKSGGAGGGSAGTPPGLPRRISGTPSQGVEMQIPSRPATPSANSAASTPTPRATPLMVRSPLIPQDGAGQMPSLAGVVKPQPPPPRAAFATATSDSRTLPAAANPDAVAAPAAGADDNDDDWAAFESEVVHAPPPPPPKPTLPAAAGYTGEAVIAAAPMTAEQLAAAAKQEETDREKRRAQVDVDLEDEEEEAKRALENEFEEMEEFEARVRRLKEKREAIRRGSVPVPTTEHAVGASGSIDLPEVEGKDGANATTKDDAEEDEEDDDDDEDEEDDWAGFRFRA